LTQKRAYFRIIAATNRDLAKEVEKGTFRRDLYYRLNVVTLRLSPLRDRREDIPHLIRHFLERYGRQQPMEPDVLEALISYDWPGNVRELENCIQHMLAINSGPAFHNRDLPSSVMNSIVRRPVPVILNPHVPAEAALPLPGPHPMSALMGAGASAAPALATLPVVPLAELEKQAIIRALEYTKGDRMSAANLLGIGRTTLYRKLKEYELAEDAAAGATA
jgi:DNA-binding NtrC family response regulator